MNARPRRHTVLAYGATLLAGALVGMALTLALQSAAPATPTVATEANPCGVKQPSAPAAVSSNQAQPSVTAHLADGPTAKWIARPASDAQILTTTEVVLPIINQVQRGDALIVTMMLTSTCPGPVVASDTRGNRYRLISDVTDSSRHRVVIIAAFGVASLTTADSVSLGYPQSSKYHISVDEFRGITTPVQHAEASGNSGGSAFSTSADPSACTTGDLVVAAVGTNTGTAPAFTEGWTTLPVLKLSSYRLTTAYQVATTSDRCAATGHTTGQWGAVLATFR